MVISMNCVRLKALTLILVLLLFPLRASADLYCEADVTQKHIALTFDDGPHYKYTAEILDILKKYDVKATFFTVGTNVERFPDLIDRELSEGHEVANHTYSHKHMADLNEKEFIGEVLGWEDSVFPHSEYTDRLFRPPEGILTDNECEVIKELGYDIILWSVDTRDWAHTPVDKIVENVMSHVDNGAIILFHDFVSGSNSPTPKALEILIPKLKEQGYKFSTVSDLIG